jgi:hypothetical protein
MEGTKLLGGTTSIPSTSRRRFAWIDREYPGKTSSPSPDRRH